MCFGNHMGTKSIPRKTKQRQGPGWRVEIRGERETWHVTCKNKREVRSIKITHREKFKMFKDGKCFPLTHSEGKSLSTPSVNSLWDEEKHWALFLQNYLQVFSHRLMAGDQDQKPQCPPLLWLQKKWAASVKIQVPAAESFRGDLSKPCLDWLSGYEVSLWQGT